MQITWVVTLRLGKILSVRTIHTGITLLFGAHHNVIAGNLIGTDSTGTHSAGVQQRGVNLQSPYNPRRWTGSL